MKEQIIGRQREKDLLDKIYQSGRSEFVAICGRRRVGKTFLVKEFFEGEFVFQTSGLANEGSRRQIKAFYEDLLEYGLPRQPKRPTDWLEVFAFLRELVKQSDKERKVIFLAVDGHTAIGFRIGFGAFLELLGIGAARHRFGGLRFGYFVDDGQGHQQSRGLAQSPDLPNFP